MKIQELVIRLDAISTMVNSIRIGENAFTLEQVEEDVESLLKSLQEGE